MHTRNPWMVLLVLTGCPRPEPEVRCDAVVTGLEPATVSALGFAAQDLLDTITWTSDATLRYPATGADTTLRTALTPGAARLVDEAAFAHHADGTVEPADGACDDRMEIDAVLAFTTADGAFDEQLAATLRATAPDAASTRVALDPEALNGTFRIEEHVPEGTYAELNVTLDAGFTADGSSGLIGATGQLRSDECADCVSYMAEDVARWP